MNKDFEDVYKQVLEQIPSLRLKHGGMEPPQKPKAKIHPMVKLANYIEKHHLRLVDFFNKFDKDGSMSVTHEEFVEGIEVCNSIKTIFYSITSICSVYNLSSIFQPMAL